MLQTDLHSQKLMVTFRQTWWLDVSLGLYENATKTMYYKWQINVLPLSSRLLLVKVQ